MSSLLVSGRGRSFVCLAWTCLTFACSHQDNAGDGGVDVVPDGAVGHVAELDAGAHGSLDAAAADAAAALACPEPDAGLPSDVFCTGLYKGQDPTQHVSSAMPYTPGTKFWSDGAQKDRFLYLPPNSKIDTSNLDAWKFPVGTKAWKEFRIDGKLVETRLFWKRSATKWESGTYVWDSTTTKAPLNTELKGIILPSGYEIPAARDCGKCHHGGSDSLLGVEAVVLALPTAMGTTLTELVAMGALSHPPAQTHMTLPEDSTGKAAAALGYLHVNCGMPCHSSRGLGDETQLVLRLRADEIWGATSSDGGLGAAHGDAVTVPVNLTDTYRATLNQPPTTASVAQKFPGAHRIVPGSHEQSLVWQLSHIRGNYQMPPLVSHSVDEAGTAALAEWIDAL